ncbi:hypothetical protein [Nocardia sp. NPDC057440]|uniref:hypothetical protein n=1 Tax=Nocardia sp. NPDC057440 TaxID=3346134 RepID=UPI00366FD73B
MKLAFLKRDVLAMAGIGLGLVVAGAFMLAGPWALIVSGGLIVAASSFIDF